MTPPKPWGQPAPEIMAEQNPDRREIHKIRVVNQAGAAITVSNDNGVTWQEIGRVLQAADRVNPAGYTASGWAKAGAVCATAVNNIHLKVAHDDATGSRMLVSLVPRDGYQPPEGYGSYQSGCSGIFTDIPSGTGLFREWAPFLGNPFLVNGAVPSTQWVPAEGDVLEIAVLAPQPYPVELEFENQFGGLITLRYAGIEKVIGQVLRPAQGVGRFEGSTYADVGAVRANHTGVICISTTPYAPKPAPDGRERRGGFQIIPAHHAHSPEMINARVLTQWMVIGPLTATDPSPEGIAPLFSGYLRPGYATQVRLDDGDWQEMPVRYAVGEEMHRALTDLTHLRIVFPTL